METIFYLWGSLPSKKNKRVNLPDGRSFPSKEYREWEKKAQEEIRNAHNGEPSKKDVTLYVLTNTKGDLDNKLSSIMDAAKGILYEDDRQVSVAAIWRTKREKKEPLATICICQDITEEDEG